MNICLCGTEAGYPHDPTCPYPLYRPTAAQEDDWLRARQEMRRRLLAELQKRPDREVAKAGEFRRVWQTLEAFGHCDGWGGMQCHRVWREYVAAGMPEDVAGFIRRRANILSDGSEPGPA